MEEVTTKALIIGVSIFVTLLIITVIIFEFTQIKDIYKVVGETDISFEASLDELNKYKNSSNEFSGLDVRNTFEKYKDNDSMDVCIYKNDEEICYDYIEGENGYIKKYYAELKETSKGYRIVFKEKNVGGT